MRKLTNIEAGALVWLAKKEPYCPGLDPAFRDVLAVLDSLCTKKRATWSESDDGPVYRLTATGRAEVEANA